MSIGFKNWDLLLKDYFHKEIHFLEIGVYKGEIVKRIAPVFLDHPNSSYTGVDTWKGSEEYMDTDFEEIERIARESAKSTGKLNQITFLKMSSFDGLFKLTQEKRLFDIIFIDASHEGRDVISDAVLAWRLLKTNGILIFDDYIWNKLSPAYYTPKPAIDSFVYLYTDEIKVLLVERQYYLQKIKPTKKPYLTLLNNKLTELLNTFWSNYLDEKRIIYSIESFDSIGFKVELLSNKSSMEKYIEQNLRTFIEEPELRFLKFAYADLDLSIGDSSDSNLVDKIKEFKLFDKYHVRFYHVLKKLITKSDTDMIVFRASKIDEPDEYYAVRDEMIFHMTKKKVKTTILNNRDFSKKSKSYIDITFTDIENDLKKVESDMTDIFFGLEGWNVWISVKDLKSAEQFIANQQKYQIYSLTLALKTLRKNGTFVIGCTDFNLPFLGDYIILLNILFSDVRIYTFTSRIGFPQMLIIAAGFKKNKIIDSLSTSLTKLFKNFENQIHNRILTVEHSLHTFINNSNLKYTQDSIELVMKYINKYSYQLLDTKNSKFLSDLKYFQRKRTIEDIDKLFDDISLRKKQNFIK